jgi:tight adherence protein C
VALLLVLGTILVAVAATILIDAAFRPSEARRAAIRRVASYASVSEQPRAPQVQRPRLTETIVPALSRVGLKLTPRGHRSQIGLKLEAAGMAGRLDAERYMALKVVFALAAIVIAFAWAGFGLGGFLLAVLLVLACLLLPDWLLVRRAAARAERLTAHLPEVIDQLVISLEAGLAFDAAVSYFVRKGRSPLARELRVMLSEVRMGESRIDALKRLAERVPSDEMRSFVHTLVQAEGVGISRATILRNQAADLRQRRQLDAEEQAHRAPIKILFPTVVFILPVMFIVILGPAVQQISRVLG